MKISAYSPNSGGILTVDFSMDEVRPVPHSVDFKFNEEYTININFWMFQAIRRNVDLIPGSTPYNSTEDKIRTIKAIRNHYSIGLKEAKWIVEWFFENVTRDVIGEL